MGQPKIWGPKVCPRWLSVKSRQWVMLGGSHLTSEGPPSLQEMLLVVHLASTHPTPVPVIHGILKHHQSRVLPRMWEGTHPFCGCESHNCRLNGCGQMHYATIDVLRLVNWGLQEQPPWTLQHPPKGALICPHPIRDVPHTDRMRLRD